MKLKKSTKLWIGTVVGLSAMTACIITPAVCCTKTQPVSNRTTNDAVANSVTNSNTASTNVVANSNKTNSTASSNNASLGNANTLPTSNNSQSSVNSTTNTFSSQAPTPTAFQITDLSSSSLANESTFAFTCPNGNVLNLTINNSNAGTLTLLGFSGSMKNSVLNIPNIVIHDNSFYIITQINAGAFYGQGLTQVNFNTNLQSIGALAFANNDLTSLSFPNDLQSIGDKAFISNQFPHAYAVYLPNNTTWNKDWLNCPFGCKDNMNKLMNGIQWVIQGTAAYCYQPDQYAWVITSYNVDTASSSKNTQVTDSLDKTDWERDPISNGSQHSYSSISSLGNFNDFTYAEANNTTLSDFCIYTQNQWGGVGWVFYFNPSNHTLNLYIRNNDQYLFGNSVSSTFSLSLWDPHTGSYDVNLQNISASTQTLATTSWTYHEGDVLRFGTTNFQSSCRAYVASNFNSSMLYSSSPLFNGGVLNKYMNQSFNPNQLNYSDLMNDPSQWSYPYSFTEKQQLPTYFTIKPTGIYHTLGVTSLSNVSYAPSSGALDISGNSLPNLNFGIYISGNKVGLFSTNNDGTFNASLNIGTGYNASTNFTIQCTSTGVMVPEPYTSHLQGFNPKLSLIWLSIENPNWTNSPVNGGPEPILSEMLFDGMDNKVVASNVVRYFPAYATPWNSYTQSINSFSNPSFPGAGSINVEVTTPNGSTSNYSFNFTTSSNEQDLNNFIDTLPYQVNDTYTFSGQYLTFYSVYENNKVVPYYSNSAGTSITFKVTDSGYIFEDKTLQNADLNPTMEETNSGVQNQWETTYGWMISLDDTENCQDYNAPFEQAPNYSYLISNWDDPNQLMMKVMKQISQAFSNPMEEAYAVADWVGYNLEYTENYYQRTIRQIFQNMMGACGDYAALTAIMLQHLGFVTRIIGGNAIEDNMAGFDDANQNTFTADHMWMQVWFPSVQEWCTFDPTWSWTTGIQYISDVGTTENLLNTQRDNMNVEAVLWPWKGEGLTYDQYGTVSYSKFDYDNYFSYFKGCEYDALYNVGREFDVPNGLWNSLTDYDFNSAMVWELNWAANPNNTNPNNGPYMETNWNGNY